MTRYTKDQDKAIDATVCEDCYLTITGADPGVADLAAFLASHTAGLDGALATPGHLAERAHPGQDCDPENGCDRTESSKWPCGVCRSHLAGRRYDITLWPAI